MRSVYKKRIAGLLHMPTINVQINRKSSIIIFSIPNCIFDCFPPYYLCHSAIVCSCVEMNLKNKHEKNSKWL